MSSIRVPQWTHIYNNASPTNDAYYPYHHAIAAAVGSKDGTVERCRFFFSKTRETRVSKSNNWSPYCGQLGTMRLLVGSDQGGAVRGCKRVNRCHYHRTQLERMACLDVSTAAIPDRARRFVPGHLYLDHSCHPAHPCTVR